MTLQSKMTELADAVRERFGKTGKLSIDDMIQLVKLPPFKSGTVIASNIDLGYSGTINQRIKMPAVPPKMNISMQINVSLGQYSSIENGIIVLNLQNGQKLTLHLPIIRANQTGSVTIPAGTALSVDDPIITLTSNNGAGRITQITITY